MDFIYNNFDFVFKKNSIQILIIGIGGGSDIILSKILMDKLNSELNQKFKDKTFTFYLANCKTTPPDKNNSVEIYPGLYKIVCKKHENIKLTPDIETNKTLLLEKYIAKIYNEDIYIMIANDEIIPSLNRMNFDLVMAEDTGGDSLVKGVDLDNRDKKMLDILKQITNEKGLVPMIHTVVSPGIDGESKIYIMLM